MAHSSMCLTKAVAKAKDGRWAIELYHFRVGTHKHACKKRPHFKFWSCVKEERLTKKLRALLRFKITISTTPVNDIPKIRELVIRSQISE